MEVHNGHVKRLTDQEVNSIVLEIVSTNVATTYISCPKRNQVLGIRLPFLVMIVKNLKRYFSFEITILDDKNMRRRFRISNFQSTTKIKPFCTSMPIGLSGGWNQIQFNLADFTRRAYGSQFIETLRVQVHANARLRRIYFSDRLYTEEELPQDYKLYLPLERKQKKKDKKEEPIKPTVSKTAQPSAVPEGEEVVEVMPPADVPPKARQSVVKKPSVTAVVEPTEEAAEAAPAEAGEGAAPAEVPAEGGAETVEGGTPAEGEVVAEGEKPAEGEAPVEGEVPPEAAAESEVATPVEGGEPPAEAAEGEAPVEAQAEAPAEAPVEEAPAEAAAEG